MWLNSENLGFSILVWFCWFFVYFGGRQWGNFVVGAVGLTRELLLCELFSES